MLDPTVWLAGFLLAAVQVAAALPWLRAVDPRGFDRSARDPGTLGMFLAAVVALGSAVSLFLGSKADSANLGFYGKLYGALLHLQILIDLFIFTPVALAWVWPKGGAVALAAYREGWRNPLFWLIASGGAVLLALAVALPYFTFGDDYKMMKEISFDLVLLAALAFGVLAASTSISEEIEGRTALTVMSKPISRRQFLVGKFLGILMACGAMSLLLGWALNFGLWAKPEMDPLDKDQAIDRLALQGKQIVVPKVVAVVPGVAGKRAAEGVGAWFGESFAHLFGITLGFGKVMILVAVATALATRLPFAVNVVVCLSVYFLGHLAPRVVQAADAAPGGGTGVGLVRFLGNLFDTLLPALEFFNMGPAVVRDAPLDFAAFAGYVATVVGYSALYSAIALLVGLLLFEDRDLA